MGIHIRQEGKEYADNKWIIEINEKWAVIDGEQEEQLLQFLKGQLIPYSVNYIFEGISIELNNVKIIRKEFSEMKFILEKLLFYKNLYVNPKPDTEIQLKFI